MDPLRPVDGALSRKGTGRYTPEFFQAMLASALFFVSYFSLYAVLPLYALHVGVGESLWGLAVTLLSWTAVAVRLGGGTVADRIGRRTVMMVGGGAMIAAAVFLLATHGLVGLLIARALQGVGVGVFTTAYKAKIMDLAPAGRQGEAVGLGNLTFGLGMVIAPPLGQLIQSLAGYNAAFVLAGGTGLLCVLGVLALPHTVHRGTSKPLLAAGRELLPRRSMQIGMWGMLGGASVLTAILNFMPLLTEERGIRGAGIAFSVYALAELSGHPIGGRIGQSMGRRAVIVSGLLIAATGVICLRQTQTTALLYAGAAAAGFGVAIVRVSLDTLVFEGAPLDLRATAAGLEYSGMDGWSGMLSWIVGLVVAEAGYNAAYGLMAAIPLVWIVVMWLMVPPREQEAVLRPAASMEAAADR